MNITLINAYAIDKESARKAEIELLTSHRLQTIIIPGIYRAAINDRESFTTYNLINAVVIDPNDCANAEAELDSICQYLDIRNYLIEVIRSKTDNSNITYDIKVTWPWNP